MDGKKVRLVTRETREDPVGRIAVREGGVYFVSEDPVNFGLSEADVAGEDEFVYELFSQKDPDDKVGGHGAESLELI